MKHRRADVVVVGAGISGLTAALRLRKEGITTTVLEARSRVGGRILRLVASDGSGYDGGGQFVGGGQGAVRALLEDMGLNCARVASHGDVVRLESGIRRVSSPTDDGDEWTRESSEVLRELDSLAMTLSQSAPWTHPDASLWDRRTFRSWTLETSAQYSTRTLVESALAPAGPAEDVSLLHVLKFLRSVGGVKGFLGARDSVVVGGMFRLPERLASSVENDVVVSSPVRSIERGQKGVVVRSDGVVVRADVAIVALAPSLAERIQFMPDLPPRRRLMQQHWLQMPAIKSMAIYPEPWWRDRGLSGRVLSDLPVAPIMVDASPPDRGVGVIAGLTNYSRRLPTWVIEDAGRRRAAFLDAINKAFGPGTPALADYLEGYWFGRTWTDGAAPMLPCGFLTTLGDASRAPVGRIVWGGTEVSDTWTGYIEGAVAAGEDSASKARALLTTHGS